MTLSNASSTPQRLPRSWWSRNWKWLVPVGCLFPLVVCGGGATAILALVFGVMKSTEPYQHAMTIAPSNTDVVAAIGSPLKAGFFVAGNINVNGPSGNADISIPISGPKGSGTIYVVAHKAGGVWSYSRLTFQASGSQQPVNLLAEP